MFMMIQSIKRIFSSSQYTTKMALIVRSDLKMSKGKTAAQCSHASVLCYQKSLTINPEILRDWCIAGQPKIVLKIDDIKELEKLAKHAENLKVISEIVHDAGRTQLQAGTITVMGLGPDVVEKIDELVKHLKLL